MALKKDARAKSTTVRSAPRKVKSANVVRGRGASGDNGHGSSHARASRDPGVARGTSTPEDQALQQLLEALQAARDGDFTVRLPGRKGGVLGQIEAMYNDVVEKNARMANELVRVGKVIGREGRMTERVALGSVGGSWNTSMDSINALIDDLVRPTTEVARVIVAVAEGDLSQKMALKIAGQPVKGEFLRIGTTVNSMVDQLSSFAAEVSRVAKEVGTDGKLGGQAKVKGVSGTWKDLTDNVNFMAGNLTDQVRNIAQVTTAVAGGDLSQKITVDAKGEILELKNTINTMVDQLGSFAAEVTRVAREVGTEGKLGGQAEVEGVSGTWKDLTDNVNFMAANLTQQVRGIIKVVTAVANGDLNQKFVLEAKGEVATLAGTINSMTDTLRTFADQVTSVAREVGIEGKLGGQARVPGVAGTWKDLTDNVNAMAANLTGQVRAIAEVATAVTQGDLTRSIMVEAMGEVAALKDNINEMIRNLKETTRKNDQQAWLKSNLAKFSRMLQGQGDLVVASQLVLSELAPLVHALQGVLYAQSTHSGDRCLEMVASYASGPDRHLAKVVRMGEGLVGQCAVEKKRILLEEVPQDYIRISSSLGSAVPVNIVILPVLFEGDVKAVLELASIKTFNATRLSFLDQLADGLGVVFNTIEANTRTRDLLAQSQLLTRELQKQQTELKQTNDRLGQQADSLQKSESLLKTQQEELRRANDELQHKAQLLSEQMGQVEYKNQEIELAKAALEEKAEQLALSSRYKSEFLANMSHELRTPLNSLMILAKLLADNGGDNLTPKQIDYAQTIYAAGADLLALISDILDLAKIESGTITLDFGPLRLTDLRDYVDRTFRPTALEQNLDFTISIDPRLPTVIETDEKRLQRILKNLLSNAFKFTAKGTVELRMMPAESGWSPGRAQLDAAAQVIAFVVADSGVGIPADKQKVIFEAFQQADGTTSRRYGGTGLGLSISRELTGLLGGEITVESAPGTGSTFVLYLPLPKEPAVGRAPPAARGAETTAPGALAAQQRAQPPRAGPALTRVPQTDDDHDNIDPGDRVALIVENDARFAAALLDIAKEHGFKGVIASNGGAALTLAQALRPDAITLALRLPDVDGWVALERLKHSVQTRHIPVNLVSLVDQTRESLHLGAVAVVRKESTSEALREALL